MCLDHVGQLTRTKKRSTRLERRHHRSKGDYSRHIREALMVVEKLPEVNPPSGRVSGQVRRAIPILESLRGGTEEKIVKIRGS